MSGHAGLQVRRVGYALGAEVRGIDLRAAPDAATVAAVRAIWLEHQVLCFPGQDLDRAGLLAFARAFGELEQVSKENVDPETPNITLLTNRPVDGKPWDGFKNGQNWHSDKSYTTRPTVASMVLCKEIPPVGGDTMFANMYLAYETLSPALRAILDGLSAAHGRSMAVRFPVRRTDGGRDQQSLSRNRGAGKPPVVHPVVRAHPETGRKALYLGPRARQFVGMTDEESRPLLDFLNEHAVRYEFTYRHRWTAGDLVMWDNRCTMHVALSDYDLRNDPRHMLRCAVTGPHSGYALESETAAGAGR